MNQQELTIHCPLSTFFENHVDFHHFREVHGHYSDPILIKCVFHGNQYSAIYSLRYGKRVKKTLIYHYTVTKLNATRWQGIIDTRYFGVDCHIVYDAVSQGEEIALNISVHVSALLLPNSVCRSLAQYVQKLTTTEFYRDKHAIENNRNRFPKPSLEQNDEALKQFREFAQ